MYLKMNAHIHLIHVDMYLQKLMILLLLCQCSKQIMQLIQIIVIIIDFCFSWGGYWKVSCVF